MSPRLHVVLHEATRTGAPRVLLEQLRHLKATTGTEVAVELLVGGELADELLALDDGIDPATADVVVVNSAVAAGRLADLPTGVPSVLYVHEDGATVAALDAAGRDAVTRYDRVLCVSDAILGQLADLGVPRDRLAVLPPVVVAGTAPSADAVATARSAMGGVDDPGQRLVLGCGEGGWRKGADLFVAVAHQVVAAGAPVRFAWVGRRPPAFARLLDHDVARAGLGDRVRWLGEVADVRTHLAAADLLLLTSRHDPQPLVAIEAALAGTPSAGFAVGGVAELAADGGASVVPYPDVPGLGALVTELLDHPAAGDRLVAGAIDRWRRRQAIEVVGPRFVATIEGLLGAVRR